MVLGRFKQNSAVLYPSSYLGEIRGEGGSKVRKGKRRSLTSLLLCKSSLNVCTEELWVLPFAGTQEHKWVETSRTEPVQKVNCFVCHICVSLQLQPGVLALHSRELHKQMESSVFLALLLPFMLWISQGMPFFCVLNQRIPKWRSRLFHSVHVGEKCRVLGVAWFRAIQFMGVVTASTCTGAFLASTGLLKEMEKLSQCVGRWGPDK